MRLSSITARTHADGNRIDLSWTNPDPAEFPGMRVVRREGTHAVGPDEGVVVEARHRLSFGERIGD